MRLDKLHNAGSDDNAVGQAEQPADILPALDSDTDTDRRSAQGADPPEPFSNGPADAQRKSCYTGLGYVVDEAGTGLGNLLQTKP